MCGCSSLTSGGKLSLLGRRDGSSGLTANIGDLAWRMPPTSSSVEALRFGWLFDSVKKSFMKEALTFSIPLSFVDTDLNGVFSKACPPSRVRPHIYIYIFSTVETPLQDIARLLFHRNASSGKRS